MEKLIEEYRKTQDNLCERMDEIRKQMRTARGQEHIALTNRYNIMQAEIQEIDAKIAHMAKSRIGHTRF